MLGNFEIRKNDLSLKPGITNTSDFSSICSVLFCLNNFQFNALPDFSNLTVWNQSVAYGYVFPLHGLVESTRNSEDVELREGRDNRRVKTREGKYRFQLGIVCDIDYYIRLKSYEGRELKCFLGDINNNLIGYKVDTTVKPLTIDSIYVSRIEIGSNQPAWTLITLDLNNPLEVNYSVKPTFNFESIFNLAVDIQNLTQVDSDSMTFDVVDACGEGITGLIAANFSISDNVNGSIAISLLTEIGGGAYRIDGAENFYAGTLRLISSNYNAFEPYSFSVPQYNPTRYNNTQYKVS
jgi:hypothetical protein